MDDRYPTLCHDEPSADEEKTAYDALRKEMQNSKPRSNIFLPLLKTTFVARRHFILHNAVSVNDILRDYPAMKESSSVSMLIYTYIHA